MVKTREYNTDLEATVQRLSDKEELFKGVKRLGVAVSGGADSVALLFLVVSLCKQKKITPVVLHLDHGLRATSAQEAKWVRALSKKLGLLCVAERREVTAHLTSALSVEMAAREVRQAFFADCRMRLKLDAIATGHQADDVAETLLLRLMRGAGGSGLAPLKAKGSGFIRPLLHVTGAALRVWLKQKKITWREDETNQDVTIPRNRIRREILPLLEKHFGDGVRSNLCKSAEILRAEDDCLDALSRDLLSDCLLGDRENALELKRLRTSPLALQRRVLRLWLWQHELPLCSGFEGVERLCAMEAGDKIQTQVTDLLK